MAILSFHIRKPSLKTVKKVWIAVFLNHTKKTGNHCSSHLYTVMKLCMAYRLFSAHMFCSSAYFLRQRGLFAISWCWRQTFSSALMDSNMKRVMGDKRYHRFNAAAYWNWMAQKVRSRHTVLPPCLLGLPFGVGALLYLSMLAPFSRFYSLCIPDSWQMMHRFQRRHDSLVFNHRG